MFRTCQVGAAPLLKGQLLIVERARGICAGPAPRGVAWCNVSEAWACARVADSFSPLRPPPPGEAPHEAAGDDSRARGAS